MRRALAWAVWQNSLEVLKEFVCVLALRKLCGLIGIDCELPVRVASQHLIENGGP